MCVAYGFEFWVLGCGVLLMSGVVWREGGYILEYQEANG